MQLSDALDLAGSTRQSVLTTIRGNGRPQLSNVFHRLAADGTLQVSVTADRAKYRNLLREPWAALHVTSSDFFAYAVLEGEVSLSAIVRQPGDPVADQLVEHIRVLVGEPDDEAAFRRTLVAEQRVLLSLAPQRAYGMLALTPRADG